ncbi:hypothetical protein DPMN_103708 [Dreissena polymorpha]|uniref:Uncharacterized protein n=1 Tax=Dreissena polymorpha TaxID=45954 RepID=A0A9D4K118_DREPO|nr:hypothetical protein DPMN_103708 [Dreissena polymorpha]
MVYDVYISGTTVQEETELVDILPCIPVGGSRYYTPPFLNTTFPQILDNRVIPKLHISGKMPSSMDQSDLSNLKWSDPIDLLVAADNFVSIPGLADVKVHVIKVAMVTNVTISPISKADVSAKEIRSRLKGKERTITVTPQIKFNEESTPKEAALEVSRATDSKKTESSKPKSSLLKISVGVLAKHVSIVMLDEVSSATLKQELICFTLDDLFIATYPASDLLEMPNYHRNCIVMSCGNVQLDNQKYQTENFDFPVVLVRKDFDKPWKGCDVEHLTQLNVLEKQAVLKSSSIMHIQIVYGTVSGRNSVIEKIECSIKPVNCYIDDKFVLHCIKQVGTFLPVPLSIPEPLPMTTLKLPKSVKTVAQSLSSPVQIGHLLIHPVSAMFSVHASMKLFIASDETPLQFGKFEKLDLSTTSYQLTRALAMHYAFGALFRAGMCLNNASVHVTRKIFIFRIFIFFYKL